MSNLHLEVYRRVKEMESTQWIQKDRIGDIPNQYPILTRKDLQKIKVDKNLPFGRSSGSTGEPVYVQKNKNQLIWYISTNIREILWRKWDTSKKLAVIRAGIYEPSITGWINNPYLFQNETGKIYSHPLKGDLNSWIKEIKPDYLYTYPSIISMIDVSGIIDIKSTGERGSTMYSCEEVGTIGIECPDNPDVYHVMENIVIEIDQDNNIIATDLTHPYIKRYLIGDKGEFGTCNCGRGLQTLKKDVIGRIRNMVTYPDGTKSWPTFGSIKIREVSDKITRIQGIQTGIGNITLKVQGDISEDIYPDIIELTQDSLGYQFDIKIEMVNEFPEGKFEEFISLI